jgi:hypothetical protein
MADHPLSSVLRARFSISRSDDAPRRETLPVRSPSDHRARNALLAQTLAWSLSGVTMRRNRTGEPALTVLSDPPV